MSSIGDENSCRNDTYTCIFCRKKLALKYAQLFCLECNVFFEIRSGIPILTEKERYWCNLPKEKMRNLNADAKNTCWADAVKKHIRGNVVGHILGENRIDFRYILPDLKDKTVLDVGSMWGGISIPIARYAKEVYSVDTTYETLELLSIRAKQDGFKNINVALASAYNLPFADKFFDVVLLIGVLEWLGSFDDFIACEHYGKKRKSYHRTACAPKQLQLAALEEIRRVLKPGGVVMVAIENRFFYKYFMGYPDAHTAVRFSAIMPRFAADLYMRVLKNKGYSEYTYSYFEHKKIFNSLGFRETSFFAAMPSYRDPSIIVPINNSAAINFYFNNYRSNKLRGIKRIIADLLVKLNLMRYFVPSFLILAEK